MPQEKGLLEHHSGNLAQYGIIVVKYMWKCLLKMPFKDRLIYIFYIIISVFAFR